MRKYLGKTRLLSAFCVGIGVTFKCISCASQWFPRPPHTQQVWRAGCECMACCLCRVCLHGEPAGLWEGGRSDLSTADFTVTDNHVLGCWENPTDVFKARLASGQMDWVWQWEWPTPKARGLKVSKSEMVLTQVHTLTPNQKLSKSLEAYHKQSPPS